MVKLRGFNSSFPFLLGKEAEGTLQMTMDLYCHVTEDKIKRKGLKKPVNTGGFKKNGTI